MSDEQTIPSAPESDPLPSAGAMMEYRLAKMEARIQELESEVSALKSPKNPYREWEEEAARRGWSEYARPKNVPPPVMWPMGPPQWPGPFSPPSTGNPYPVYPGTWCQTDGYRAILDGVGCRIYPVSNCQ